MRVGEEVRAYLPFDRAYVTYELPNVFPAYSAFILQLELANALDSLTLSRQQDERIKAYLAENELLPADSLQGGVYYHRTEEGEAPEVGPDNTARVRYTGRLLDGTTFDSNTDAPNPLRVNMSERAFIPGFMSGIGAMSQQERGTVVLPYHQGYGANFYVMPFSIMNDLISEGIVPSSASLGTYAPLRFDLFVEAVN
jgi:FKBP-type peptidyl-prolyl cis-trans isomerase